ncbi:MAG: hypothetical protein ACRCXB_11680 [Aeromonadaceae bacterium]
MKISSSKKELARIISENGGWRDGAEFSAQDGDGTGSMDFFKSKPRYDKDDKYWKGEYDYQNRIKYADVTIKGFHQTILSREEYFHLYPSPDADGWIEWNGGECPVDGDCEVSIKVMGESGSAIGKAKHWSWGHSGDGSDIIAYRPQKPTQAQQQYPVEMAFDIIKQDAKPESKPIIEQLAADYRNRKDYADRKQTEADAAKADAEAKLAELVAAGKALNLVISVGEKEPELVITDWRDLKVDDVISVQCFEKVYSQSTVLAVGVSDVLIRSHVGARKTVNLDERDWSFIRRP